MKDALAWSFVSVLLSGIPAYAQNPCVDCLTAADEKLKTCLENAISVEDKNSCGDNQEEQVKKCEDRECRVERESHEKSVEVPSSQGR